MTLGNSIGFSCTRWDFECCRFFPFGEPSTSNTIWTRRFRQPFCQGADVNSRDAFVPPKPKEFDKAALIGMVFEVVRGMKASLNTGSGCDRLSVGGAIPCNKTGKQQIKRRVTTQIH
ncbi:hypothetical protein ACFX2J_045511 [Malus domestica]